MVDSRTRSNYDPNPKPISVRVEMDSQTRSELDDRGHQVVREINQKIQGVLDEAPSDATATLLVRKCRDGYKGLLKIYSSQRRFVGGSVERKLADVIESIFAEVQGQIGNWKRHRQLTTSDP